MDNARVIASFLAGERANARGATLSSEAAPDGGVSLFSYAEPIAHLTRVGGVLTVYDDAAPYSATTSKHLGQVRTAAHTGRVYARGGSAIETDEPEFIGSGTRVELRKLAGLDPNAAPEVTRKRGETVARRPDGSVVHMGETA